MVVVTGKIVVIFVVGKCLVDAVVRNFAVDFDIWVLVSILMLDVVGNCVVDAVVSKCVVDVAI